MRGTAYAPGPAYAQIHSLETLHTMCSLTLEQLIGLGVVRGHARDILEAVQLSLPPPSHAPQSTALATPEAGTRVASSMHGTPTVSLRDSSPVVSLGRSGEGRPRVHATAYEKMGAVFREFDEEGSGGIGKEEFLLALDLLGHLGDPGGIGPAPVTFRMSLGRARLPLLHRVMVSLGGRGGE